MPGVDPKMRRATTLYGQSSIRVSRASIHILSPTTHSADRWVNCTATTKSGRTSTGPALTINDPGNAALAITVGATHRDSPDTYGVSFFSSKGPAGGWSRQTRHSLALAGQRDAVEGQPVPETPRCESASNVAPRHASLRSLILKGFLARCRLAPKQLLSWRNHDSHRVRTCFLSTAHSGCYCIIA
jgi:hypothetical protein